MTEGKINTVLLSFLALLGLASCGEKTKTHIANDISFVQPDSDNFVMSYQGQVLLEGSLWHPYGLSGLQIPLDDSIREDCWFNLEGAVSKKRRSKLVAGRYAEDSPVYHFGYCSVMDCKQRVRSVKGKYIRDGYSYHFNDQGALLYSTYYKEGIEDGIYTSYYDNGAVEYMGRYTNGDSSGVWRHFSKEGELLDVKKF